MPNVKLVSLVAEYPAFTQVKIRKTLVCAAFQAVEIYLSCPVTKRSAFWEALLYTVHPF